MNFWHGYIIGIICGAAVATVVYTLEDDRRSERRDCMVSMVGFVVGFEYAAKDPNEKPNINNIKEQTYDLFDHCEGVEE